MGFLLTETDGYLTQEDSYLIILDGYPESPESFVKEICDYIHANSAQRFVFKQNLWAGEIPKATNGVVAVIIPQREPDRYTGVKYYQVNFIAKNTRTPSALADLRYLLQFFHQRHHYNTESFNVYFSKATTQIVDLDRETDGRKILQLSVVFTVRNLTS